MPVTETDLDPGVSFAVDASVETVFGSATQLRESVDVQVLQCCKSDSEAAISSAFGSASWWGSDSPLPEERQADGLARYYPLTVNDRELLEAQGLNPPIQPDAELEAEILSTGRDIANGHDAQAIGELREGEAGIICEDPEQFRLSRYYEIPLDVTHTELPDLPQFNFECGFTLTMWFRLVESQLEQTLFSLDPNLRVGVSWLGELTIQADLVNGESVDEWSESELIEGQWAHIALRFSPALGLVEGFIDGIREIELKLPAPIDDVTSSFIGSWREGSLINGDAQDIRLYHEILSTEFIAAEKASYCADWIEVRTL